MIRLQCILCALQPYWNTNMTTEATFVINGLSVCSHAGHIEAAKTVDIQNSTGLHVALAHLRRRPDAKR